MGVEIQQHIAATALQKRSEKIPPKEPARL